VQADASQVATLLDAIEHTNSPSDALAYRLDLALLAHPERCSTAATYPNWAPGQAVA